MEFHQKLKNTAAMSFKFFVIQKYQSYGEGNAKK